MSHDESMKLSPDLRPDGQGQPSRIYLDLDVRDKLFQRIRIGRMFLNLRKGTTWGEAEALEKDLKRLASSLTVIHLAAGES